MALDRAWGTLDSEQRATQAKMIMVLTVAAAVANLLRLVRRGLVELRTLAG